MSILIFSTACILFFIYWKIWITKPLFSRSFATHPAFVILFLHYLTLMDFSLLLADVEAGHSPDYLGSPIWSLPDVQHAALVFCIAALIASVSFFLGLATKRLPIPSFSITEASSTQILSARLVFIVFGAFAILTILPILVDAIRSADIFHLAERRTILLSENQLAGLASLLLVPAFLINAAHLRTYRNQIVFLASTSFLFLFIGSRSSILLLMLFAYFSFGQRFRVPLVSVVLTLSFAVIASVYYVYMTRFSLRFDSFWGFYDYYGGILGYVFRSPEWSVADAMSVYLSDRIVERGPMDSIVASVFAIVPREIIPWKPLGISTHLTMATDPERWELVRSEWTVGGYTGVIYEMGYVFGLFFIGILFYLFGQLLRAGVSSRTSAISSVIFVSFVFGFFRGDLYNLGLRFWAVFIVFLCYGLFYYLLSNVLRHQRLGNKQKGVDG